MNDTALQMADELDRLCDPYDGAIATELRRLHAENEHLRHAMDGLTQRCVDDTALIGELVEALETALHAFAEIHHAFMRPDWFTGGERSATQRLLMYQQRGSEATRAAIAKAKAEAGQ